MSTEFNELLPGFHGDKTHGDKSGGDKTQIWIIGTREQVVHTMNEFYVKKIANDRVKFAPIMPAPFESGKYMTVLVR
ncbi:MAG TPA: hypothetical protein V6C65_03840 [Allocoleopsis sp.]